MPSSKIAPAPAAGQLGRGERSTRRISLEEGLGLAPPPSEKAPLAGDTHPEPPPARIKVPNPLDTPGSPPRRKIIRRLGSSSSDGSPPLPCRNRLGSVEGVNNFPITTKLHWARMMEDLSVLSYNVENLLLNDSTLDALDNVVTGGSLKEIMCLAHSSSPFGGSGASYMSDVGPEAFALGTPDSTPSSIQRRLSQMSNPDEAGAVTQLSPPEARILLSNFIFLSDSLLAKVKSTTAAIVRGNEFDAGDPRIVRLQACRNAIDMMARWMRRVTFFLSSDGQVGQLNSRQNSDACVAPADADAAAEQARQELAKAKRDKQAALESTANVDTNGADAGADTDADADANADPGSDGAADKMVPRPTLADVGSGSDTTQASVSTDPGTTSPGSAPDTGGLSPSGTEPDLSALPVEVVIRASQSLEQMPDDMEADRPIRRQLYAGKGAFVRDAIATCTAGTHVFLGGSCNPTSWRKDVAIPALEANGIPFYNPQVEEWTPELVEVEAKAKKDALLLFFVVSQLTRSVASMIEACEEVCRGREVVLVVHDMAPENQLAQGSEGLFEDLNRGRVYLRDVARRYGVMCYDSVEDAINYTIRRFRLRDIA